MAHRPAKSDATNHLLLETALKQIYRYSIRHPKLVLAIALLALLAIAPGALRLRLRTDGHALVPQNAPEILYDRAIRDEFGLEDPIVVVITAHGGISPESKRGWSFQGVSIRRASLSRASCTTAGASRLPGTTDAK